MDTRHLVDPELLGLLDVFPTTVLSTEALAQMRAAERVTIAGFDVDPAVRARVAQTTHAVPGPTGAPDISVIVYRPRDARGVLPCIYHIHGGGYVGGAATMMAPFHYPLVDELGCVLVTVEYRLAPEHPFPAAIEDCYAGLAWTFANAHALDIDAARIGVMGESAGGGLAASLALMARDRGAYTLAFQHLIYPMIDDRTCVAAAANPVAGEFIWTPHNNRFGWAALLGRAPGGPDVSPYAAAARAENLSSLPPTFISTATLDLFVDENIAYAQRLMRAGAPTEFHVYPGGFHGFDMHPTARVSQATRRDSRGALKRALFG
ncbi:MAG: alpha/beta hydrolase fold domain-containing protein [Alphaproteobacteria bacterium]|nr:alpha/beta hydrolase fold domain-containing protein [Alphaproteobacteria bacterium]